MDPRRALESEMGKPLSDEAWASLEKDGFADEIRDVGDKAVQDTAERLRALRTTPKSDPVPPRASPVASRVMRGEELAAHAQRDPDVVAFRRDVMRDQLIQLDDIESWITSRAMPATNWSQSGWQIRCVEFPKDGWTGRCATTEGGDLERLRTLASRLATTYRWQPGQATAFVLTDACPIVGVRVTWTSGGLHDGAAQVDYVPPGTPPEEVERAVRDAQKRWRADTHPRRATATRDADRHRSILTFLNAHPEGTWDERRVAWRTAHPEYGNCYPDRRSFQRAAKRAGWGVAPADG